MAELTTTAEAAPRRRTFGPLFYSTLLIAALVGLYSAIELGGPALQRWLEERRLASALASQDPNERLAAISLLRGRERALAPTYLRRTLRDPDRDVRVEACEALLDVGEDPSQYIDVLIGAIGEDRGDDGVDRRAKVARVLGSLRETHRGPAPGRSAAGGGADTGMAMQRRTFEVLSALLDDPSHEVRSAAATALGKGSPLPEVSARLEAASADRETMVRLAVAGSLMRLRGGDDPAAARILVGLVDGSLPVDGEQLLGLLRSAGETTRGQVCRALLDAVRKAEPAARLQRIAILSHAGNLARGAVPDLETLLDSPDRDTRSAVAEALLSIQNDLNPESLAGAGGMAGMDGMGAEGVRRATVGNPRMLRAIEAVLLDVVGRKELPFDDRAYALYWIHRLTMDDPELLARASVPLVRQLGDGDPEVRRSAHSLLGSSIEVAPVRMPEGVPGASAPTPSAPK